MQFGIDAPIRENAKATDTLCARCRWFGYNCTDVNKTKYITDDNYICVSWCAEYEPEAAIMADLK